MIFIFDDSKEPEDIFAGTSDADISNTPPANLPTPKSRSSTQESLQKNSNKGTTPLPVGESGVIMEKSAFGKKLVFGGVIVGILLIGLGIWYFVFYNRGASLQVNQQDFTEMSGAVPSEPPPDSVTSPPLDEGVSSSDSDTRNLEDIVPSEPPSGTQTETSIGEGVTPSVPPSDTTIEDEDADGLSDAEELSIGTDPRNPDTDGDGLSDREEVRTYKTDPNNPDTDGDGYEDGSEVQNGYNPNGSGKLLQIPQ